MRSSRLALQVLWRSRLFALACLLTAPAAPTGAQIILPGPQTAEQRDCRGCPVLVQLPNGLFISRSAVTLGEYRIFAKETGHRRTHYGCHWEVSLFEQQPDHPAVCLTYTDATLYVEWLSRKTGRPYRLPTLDEMRYAALANSDDNYWWGRTIGQGRANCAGCGSAYDGKSTSPVDSFAPNPFGLLDAVGNAWIWTTDCADKDCREHFLVGGSWASPPGDLRVTKTIYNGANISFTTYGMRVVRAE